MSAHATDQDVLGVPEYLTAELIDGALFLSRRGSPRQSRMRTVLGLSLFRSPGWDVLWKPELRLGANVFVPELAGWRGECWLDDERSEQIPPNWVCDIVTPSGETYDPRIKLPTYARHGVTHAWIVDIAADRVEVKRVEKGDWTDIAVFRINEPFRAEPFLEVEIDLGSIWSSPPPS